jgi:hypothetical protein
LTHNSASCQCRSASTSGRAIEGRQEYGYSFVPDAAGNTITMTPDFLKAINDGVPVTLTFYYWSGAKTTYTVTKSGTTVTGSTA